MQCLSSSLFNFIGYFVKSFKSYEKILRILFKTDINNHLMALHCKYFKCPIADCPADFALWGRFGQHFSRRHSLKCLNCNVPQFENFSKLAEHKQYECSARSDPCDHCGKIFATPYNLRIHLRSLKLERKFICQYCGKGFTTERNVTNHTKIHTGNDKL